MSEQPQAALVVRDDARMTFNFLPEAIRIKDEALAAGALVGKVENADEQLAAVQAQQQVANILSLIEKARAAAKRPILDFGAKIDETAKQFSVELKAEQVRLATMVGDFQALEQARIRAAQQAENKRLADLEREKARALAEAQSHEQIDAIQEQFNTRAQQEAPPAPIAPTRTKGQIVREDWNIEVTDIHLLARAHPSCVNITPRLSDIKSLLNANVTVAGVRASKVTTATVRATPQPKAIEV